MEGDYWPVRRHRNDISTPLKDLYKLAHLFYLFLGSLPPSSSVGSGSYDNPSMWVTYPSLGSEYKLSASYFVHR